MQFRHLEFSALGPFPGTHTINFDELTRGGLFLFDGPTGSGKSSVIDAIVFALYGKVAGDESDDSRIRSAHADDRTESYADLVFTVQSGTYRVRRSPTWERAKVRGAGTTPVSSTARLWRLSEAAVDEGAWDSGEPLASGARSVGEELSQILSLNRKQFVQTVVLPQGQFAQFLRLNSSERSRLLETLFDTENYRNFAQALTKSADAARVTVKNAEAVAVRALQAWSDIDGVRDSYPESQGLAFVDVEDSRPIDFIVNADRELATRVEVARKIEAEREATLTAAREKRRAEEELHAALADLRSLRARREQLAAEVDEIAGLRSRVKLHEQVATAVDRLTTAVEARQQLLSAATGLPGVASLASARTSTGEGGNGDEAAKAAVVAHGELTRCIDALRAADDAQAATELAASSQAATEQTASGHVRRLGRAASELSEEASAVASALTARIGSLDALVDLEKTLAASQSQVKKLADSHTDLEALISELTAAVESTPAKLTALDEDISAARAVAETLAERNATQQKLEAQLADSKRLASLHVKLGTAAEAQRKASAKHKEQFDRVTALTASWRNSTAASLASDLVEDEPCPVCGSLEHPAPAQPPADFATLAQVREAEEKLRSLAEKLDATARAHAQLVGQEETLIEQVEGHDQAELHEALAASTKEYEAARTAQAREKELQQRRANMVSEQEKQRRQLSEKREELSTLTERLRNMRESLARDEAQVVAARGENASVVQRRQALVSQRADVTALREHAQRIAERARHDDTTHSAAASALRQAGVSADEARAAHMTHTELTQLRARIEQHSKDLAGVDAQLADKRFSAITGNEEPQVEAAREAEKEAERAYRSAHEASTLASSRARSSAQNLQRTIEAVAEWKRAVDDAGPAVRLASLANADTNSLTKIRLSTWVLLRRFEQIVSQANEHLSKFSFGRYELERVDEADGERKTGLGLRIIHRDPGCLGDHRRNIGTLSGGETFYTSLALALALSEVVQAENGGIRMETLIIDEGFGTLSSEYLESIMDTLDQLRSGGRTVGVVSHVDELKSMIQDRVSIRPLPDGGSTLEVSAGS